MSSAEYTLTEDSNAMGDYTHKGKGNQSSTRKMLDCWCILWIWRISDADRSGGKALYLMSLSSQIKKKKLLCLRKWSYAFLFHLSTSGILLEALTKHILFAPAWVCKLAFYSASASLSEVWKQWCVLILKCPFFVNTVRSLQRLLPQKKWAYPMLSRTKISV